uniref:Uncharacterized protein n=1 Tax=Cucumis melo TaxID=3656 RepID=A0A9I9DQW5_CUCME
MEVATPANAPINAITYAKNGIDIATMRVVTSSRVLTVIDIIRVAKSGDASSMAWAIG